VDILVGLDLGTTNCKALAFDTEGTPVASATAPMPAHQPQSVAMDSALGSPEYDAEELWNVSARLIRQVVDRLAPGQRVTAVAVASMGEAGVLVDVAGNPLVPILTWHDRRTLSWMDWWRERLDDADIYRITGLPLNYIYSATKLLWYREQDPLIFARPCTWLGLADWITFCLTGERTTSYSMASRTMLFDLRTRTWSEDLLRLANLPADLLPPVLPSGQVVGQVTQDAAAATDLPIGVPVVSGGHDHVCAALAAGVIAPGPVLDSAGTAEAILVTVDAPILDRDIAASGLCCGCHTVRGCYYLVGGIMSGAVVGWLARLLAGDEAPATLARLMYEAASAPPGANGLWFLPHLGGSGPPDRDPDAWGAWLGLRLSHTRANMIRAAMEGLSFALRHLLEGVQKVAGFPARELRAVGGGTRNAWWQSLKADVLGLPIELPAVTEMTAQGAALLAGIGAGVFADETEAAARAYRPAVRYDPDPGSHAKYNIAYRDVYLNLYPALRGLPLTSE
jgi:xylulokinase